MQSDWPINYHQQDTDYYCGAACSQMAVDYYGGGLNSQDDLYQACHGHSLIEPGAWYTAPDGLLWTLNHYRPASYPQVPAMYALNDEYAISRSIVWSIYGHKAPCVALVFGWQHWIVVRGFDATAAPTSIADTSYVINAFFVNNPAPPVPSGASPPPPHSAGDGCGTGGVRGLANEHIAYATWQDTYMTGVPSGYWAGKFVAACAADNSSPPLSGVGMGHAVASTGSGDALIGAEEIRHRVNEGTKAFGLHETEQWDTLLAKSKPGRPLLVQRLDRADTYYYIVPMESKRNQAPLLVSMDARFGNYRQSVTLPDRNLSALAGLYLAAEDSTKLVRNKTFELEDPKGRITVRPEGSVQHPTLVWKPCRESLSPFYPFHMTVVGSQTVFTRIDGRVFTELHDDARGL